MKKNKQQQEKVYKKGRIQPIVAHLHKAYSNWIQEHTEVKNSAKLPTLDELTQEIRRAFPEIKNKERCYNCEASMRINGYTVNEIHVALLTRMAREVRARMQKGYTFHEANKIHVQTLGLYNSKECQTTVSRYLGLIAKVKGKNGKHDTKAGWLITKRGWAFLKGEPVPKCVHAIRNQIVERPEGKMITINEIKVEDKDSWKDSDREFFYNAGRMADQTPLL